MAAALLAALFAMGVFSAGSVGAQDEGPSADSAVLAEGTPANLTTQAGDTVTIEVSGLAGLAPDDENAVTITMNEDLGTDPTATWVGSSELLSTLTVGAYAGGTGTYTMTFPATTSIFPGNGTITITLGANARIDTNTIITALTVGRATGATLNTVDVGDGLAIAGAPGGPTISISPLSALIDTAADTPANDITINITLANFVPDGEVTWGETDLDGDLTTPTDTTIDANGGLTTTATLLGSALTEAKELAITAAQTGDTAVSATFSIAAAPSPDPYTLSTDVATEGVRIEVSGESTTMVPAGEDITVQMEKWGLPSSIPEDSVLILGQGDGAYSGEPASVRLEASNKIVLSLTARYENGAAAGPLLGGQKYTVVFKKSAGITNPAIAGGRYALKLTDLDNTETFSGIQIMSKVKLAKGSGPRGTTIEATAVGVNSGDTTFYLKRTDYDAASMPMQEDGDAVYSGDGYLLGRSSASGGKATLSIDSTTQNFVPGTRLNNDGNKLQGLNVISVVDANGKTVNVSARFEITPLIELDGETFKRGGKVDITVSDWHYEDLENIKIGDLLVTQIPSGSTTAPWKTVTALGVDEYEFSFIVPNNARLGEQQLKLTGETNNLQGSVSYGDDDVAVGKIVIGAFDLTIEPSTAVTGQVIRIEGSGFEDDACITSITVGGDVNITESTSENGLGKADDLSTPDRDESDCSGDLVKADSNGNLADTFEVPGNLKSGTYRVVITDVQRRVGVADLTIPEPEIELQPAASQRGSNVVVIGSNFPAEDVITISYRGRTVTASNTDTVGRFRGTFAVPVNAPIGEESEVEAISADKADGTPPGEPTLKAKSLHRVPDEVLEVTPETAAPGTRITVSASNLPLYTPVNVFIGGVGVAGASVGELAESDGNGEWEGTPLVPQLTPGTHTVEMRVGRGATGITVSTFLEIADIITRASEEAFTDLIDNGSLSRVWFLERETQEWFFYDPAPEFAPFNTLNEVSTRQIVDIIMSAQDEFQGETLYVGSNPTSIE